jgi:transcriptional regulator with GAF, ATPase, and Fis domain
MDINENEFFRQLTVGICCSLDMNTALSRCLDYFKNYLPVSKMYLNVYEPGLSVLLNLSTVTCSGIEKPFSPLLISEDAIERFKSGWASWDNVHIINRPEIGQVPERMLQLEENPDVSFMVMFLVLEGKKLGALVISAKGRDMYTKSHAHLLSLLREPFAIAMSNAIRYKEVIKLKEKLDTENRELNRELLYLSGDKIIGEDSGLKGVMDMVRKVSTLDNPVMLLGETGVGKEVIANAIHYTSIRKDGPFIKVNCGAIPDNLIDSELFGHEKGAFTGAISQKRGRFERAHKGTIFLDEIGDLPLQAQIKILRVIQHKEIERVGGSRPIPIDDRIITATHRNLEEMISAGQFRQDLWFRLNVFPINIPPLRHRKDDVPALVSHFIERKARELKLHAPPRITDEIMERLKSYHWPGNVRELENLIERSLIISRGLKDNQILNLDHFTIPEKRYPSMPAYDQGLNLIPLEQTMAASIQHALKLTKGKIFGEGGAAQLLCINPNTLRSRMKKLGIPFGRR